MHALLTTNPHPLGNSPQSKASMDVLNTVSGDEVSGTAHGDSLQDSLTKHCAFDLDILNIIREFDEKASIKVALNCRPFTLGVPA